MRLRDDFGLFYDSDDLISIPSGAIKRTSFFNQLLNMSDISIPSGAIKRQAKFAKLQTVVKFQFLLVRLRVYIEINCQNSETNFNSFWCD